jgi:hypothetical protein
VSGPLDFGDEGGRADVRPEPRREPRPEPPAEPPPPARPPGASRYGWFIGVAAFLLLAVVTINSITTGGGQPGGPAGGDRLVAFAVPLADAPSRPDEDANVDRERACRVRGPGILNMCEQWERGPVVLALFPTNADRCRAVMDQLERMRARFPEVAFVAVGSAGDRDQLKGRSPLLVGWDRDRAVASVYGLVGCPQVSFATKGGKVIDTVRREIGDAEFARKVEALR